MTATPTGSALLPDMSDSERWKKGEETIKDVYAGDVVTAPEGSYAFTDIMLETLFAEIWTRDILSMRDKRILLLGMIAAQGERETFKIQTRAGIKNGELSAPVVIAKGQTAEVTVTNTVTGILALPTSSITSRPSRPGIFAAGVSSAWGSGRMTLPPPSR